MTGNHEKLPGEFPGYVVPKVDAIHKIPFVDDVHEGHLLWGIRNSNHVLHGVEVEQLRAVSVDEMDQILADDGQIVFPLYVDDGTILGEEHRTDPSGELRFIVGFNPPSIDTDPQAGGESAFFQPE